jgi:uncharacterized protein YceK
MKKIIFALFILAVVCSGCSTKIINVDGTKNEETTSFNAFNDESYVWESWTFSTNKVNNLK